VPFVQGQLRNEYLEFILETGCAHCGRKITIEIDSNLEYSTNDSQASPLIFVPTVDVDKLEDPSIIDAF
jgi:hypothetical protein